MILNASGCLDALTAPEVARQFDAFVTKTVTPLPREGNPPPRIAETDTGMLNTIGLANPGIEAFVDDVLPRLAELGIPIWVSVGGFSTDDYVRCCSLLDDRDEVAVVELNVSCPNVSAPEESASEICAAARGATSKPLYAKLSPAVPDVAAVAIAAANAGTDGLSLVNTIRGLALDERTLAPRLSTGAGGMSGPALRPVALAAVYACRRVVDLPSVGMGGVFTGRHALEFVSAGATAVALGTVLFADPFAASRVRAEMAAEAGDQGVDNPFELGAISLRKTPGSSVDGVDNRLHGQREKASISTQNAP